MAGTDRQDLHTLVDHIPAGEVRLRARSCAR
jgi:hypothetical protein